MSNLVVGEDLPSVFFWQLKYVTVQKYVLEAKNNHPNI